MKKLIAGPSVFICDECIELCNDIIRDEVPAEGPASRRPQVRPADARARSRRSLDQYVIGQEPAKRTLSVAVYNHYKRLKHMGRTKDEVELVKSNILLIGPTGSGKTLLAQTLARLLNVPFVIADATTLTEAGYVGEDVENIIQKLLQNCNYDVERRSAASSTSTRSTRSARKADNPSITRDVSGEGVQQALLKLIEGTMASVPPQGGRKHPNQDFLQIDTTNILFICGGAFDGLEKVIQNRTEKSGIGFARHGAQQDREAQARRGVPRGRARRPDQVRPDPRAGRPPAGGRHARRADRGRAGADPDRAEERAGQAVPEAVRDGRRRPRDPARRRSTAIARKALARKTGARGLRSIMEQSLIDTMFELPNLDGVAKVVLDEHTIEEDAKPLLVYREAGQGQRLTCRRAGPPSDDAARLPFLQFQRSGPTSA